MAATTPTPRVTIIGAGMSGSLLAIFLARRGFEVDVYERRGDLRCKEAGCAGRSIKMTLAERGSRPCARSGWNAR